MSGFFIYRNVMSFDRKVKDGNIFYELNKQNQILCKPSAS